MTTSNNKLILPETFFLPEHTITGAGTAEKLLGECAVYGSRGLIFHGKSLRESGMLKIFLANKPQGMSVISLEHSGGEPTLTQLSELLDAARSHNANWIAGAGGGSVMDLAKACAGLFNASEELAYYHDGATIETPGIIFIAIPTTAGTGSEATINSVLTNSKTSEKKSIRAAGLMARLVILDENLLLSCPKQVIASAGMDAFTQAVESYTSRHACWLSDELALKALSLIGESLEDVYNDLNSNRRSLLLTGSYLAGLSLSIARLGIVHGLAHPLGARYHIPHGLICAILLPHAIEMNKEAIKEKYALMSEALGDDLLERSRFLQQRLRIESPLKNRLIEDKPTIIRETLASGSTAANPKSVTTEDVEWLLKRIFS